MPPDSNKTKPTGHSPFAWPEKRSAKLSPEDIFRDAIHIFDDNDVGDRSRSRRRSWQDVEMEEEEFDLAQPARYSPKRYN